MVKGKRYVLTIWSIKGVSYVVCNGSQGPILADGHYSWLDDRQASKGQLMDHLFWHGVEPNGKHKEQCVTFKRWETEGFYDFDCTSRVCSLCELPESQQFYLRGLKASSLIDNSFSLSLGLQNNASNLIVFEVNTVWLFISN